MDRAGREGSEPGIPDPTPAGEAPLTVRSLFIHCGSGHAARKTVIECAADPI